MKKKPNLTLSKRELEIINSVVTNKVTSIEDLSDLQKRLWEIDYVEKPVSFSEFLTGPVFLENISGSVYNKWKVALSEFFAQDRTELILTGAIGTGKTTVGCIALLYKLYRLLCLRNPWEYYGLINGMPIIFGLYNIYKYKAGQVVLEKLRALLKIIPWFKDKIVGDYRDIIEFKNKIKIIIGARELDAIGEDLYGCIIDEVNFMKVSDSADKAQAMNLYQAVRTRIISRFHDMGRVPGIVILISSKKTESDFLNKHIEKFKNNPSTMVFDYALWDVKPDKYSGKTFRVQVGDRYRVSRILKDNEEPDSGAKVIEVPIEHYQEFQADIDGSLRDIAGVATYNYKPLIPDTTRIFECINKEHESPVSSEYVYASLDEDIPISDYILIDKFVRKSGTTYEPLVNPDAKRWIHIDLSQVKDYTGFCMIHHSGYIEEERVDFNNIRFNVYMPKFYVDLILQIRYGKSRIDFSKIRDFIFYLRTMGFKIAKITTDTYQSADFLQILSKAGFAVDNISVDRNSEPYMLLREVILGKRLDMYNHSILIEELSRLEYNSDLDKVDHPVNGSKDVSDALCGALYSCYKEISTINTYKGVTLFRKVPELNKIPNIVGNNNWAFGDSNYIIEDERVLTSGEIKEF